MRVSRQQCIAAFEDHIGSTYAKIYTLRDTTLQALGFGG